ncbi:ABC transporter ATP-binding protein [Gorillibacterium sp. sgz5001074]|uniref:ABC transporter ATP-binding protein n=1 Tax=Gorillibacterium sp. sgz5001074 TaxID=3446695 RepID=UPI003F67E15E
MALLQTIGLRKAYGSTVAVKDLSFTLEEGRCTALLGPNGAGKTTTLKLLSGLLEPSSGTIRFHSWEGDRRQHIGYLPQYPAFYKWMSGTEYVEYVAKLSGLHAKDARVRTAEMLELVGLTDAAKRRIGGYSGGMKQRLGIAQALVHRPKLLILDEPVSALDPVGRREVLELIRMIRTHTTILFSTHVLHDAEEISDDVLIMRAGEIALSGSLNELRRSHREPVIRLESDGSLEDWASGLSGRLPGLIDGVEVHDGRAVVMVTDADRAMKELIADLAAAGLPVRRFEAAASTLEDLFMKVVES